MQLGITLKIVALSTSDLKITYGVLFYMLEIVCIVKCGGKMHIWCLLACKKVSRDEEEGKVTSFFCFFVSRAATLSWDKFFFLNWLSLEGGACNLSPALCICDA